MLEGTTDRRRLPFVFQAIGGVGRLVLTDLAVFPLVVDRLELEVSELGTDPGVAPAERFQRRRTRLRHLAIKLSTSALETRVDQVRKQLAALGITQLAAKLYDGFVSVRARAADGLAAADVSFRIQLVHSGTQLRAIASTIRVHGHLPAPGPLIADRILTALLDARVEQDAESRSTRNSVADRPHVRGLCDVEIDLIGGLLWHLMPPSGWRLPASSDIELVAIKIGRGAIEIAYGPPGTRSGSISPGGVRPATHQLAAAHDLMHSVDQLLRDGHLEDAMRGYRALLASGGPDQPQVLERILALASARPAWFFDGLELARQALSRWPSFPPAHSALASVTLAQGDAREAASHLMQLAQLASADGDDDQAALAALAGARLLRVLEPRSATQLYQLALEHDPGSSEAADSLADRLADEQRWAELVRLVRARAVSTADPARAVQLRLRLADVFVHQLDDPQSAQLELAAARQLAPDDPAIHEMTATILNSIDPPKAIEEWREVARLAELRSDHRTCARAWAILGDLLSGDEAEQAWRKSLALDSLQSDALAGLANAAAKRGEHAVAAELFERMRGLGLAQTTAARHELQLARSLVVLDRTDDARNSLRRATMAGGETAAEAHAVLAEIAEATSDREHAVAELDTAISAFVDLASDDLGDGDRLYTRAAQLAVSRANLFDRTGQHAAASADYQRAHTLAQRHAPELARDAAKTLLARSDDAGTERRWIDAVLATRPPSAERAGLLVRRADVRRRERTPDLAAAIADLHEALQLTEDSASAEEVTIRRRAYQLEAELLAQSGDQRARAQALAALAKMAERAAERVEVETAAAAAWLAADEPAAALPHGARAQASIESGDAGTDVPPALRREVLVTLGEAAWRQRAWPDVIRAYSGLIEDPGAEAPRVGTFRYRLAVAADRSGGAQLALDALRPIVEDLETAATASPELRGQALRLFADLAERAGDLAGAAAALEGFAALAVENSPTARADAMYRAGELFRRAERPDDAVRCLEAALRISDSHLPALDALEAAWRERGDIERVAVILGRKVAATARHPARQKPLLSRLGDLQDQLGRPDVALATHQRALEIDPTWRPSLRFVTVKLRDSGQVIAAAGGLAQLSGELPNDSGVDLAVVARERQLAATALAVLVISVDDAQLDAIRDVVRPALERTNVDTASTPEVPHALARLRGDLPVADDDDLDDRRAGEDTQSGRILNAAVGVQTLRDAAARARVIGKLDEALATLETANHASPGDIGVLRELVELAQQLGDQEAATRHLAALAAVVTGSRRGDVLLELADVCYDKLDDAQRGRQAMRDAATAFGSGARRDTTLRMLAVEASSNLAWDIAVEALTSIVPEKRSAADVRGLALALARAGHDGQAITLLEDPTAAAKLADGGELLDQLRTDALRKAALATSLERRATRPGHAIDDPAELRAEAREIRDSVGPEIIARSDTAIDIEVPPPEPRTKTWPGTGDEKAPAAGTYSISVRTRDPSQPPIVETPGAQRVRAASQPPTDQPRTKTKSEPPIGRIKLVSVPADDTDDDTGFVSVSDPRIKSGEHALPVDGTTEHVHHDVSVVISGSPSETASAVALAAASADRDRLLSAYRDTPNDPAILTALLAHLGERDPALRTEILDDAARVASGRALAIALHELALISRERREPARAATLWMRAYEADPGYAPVWLQLADVHAASDDLSAARDLYERVAGSAEYSADRRSWAKGRAAAVDREDLAGSAAGEVPAYGTWRDEAIVSGEIRPPGLAALDHAREEAKAENWQAAIVLAERAAAADPTNPAALELLETLYLESGDLTAASEAIGRQLLIVEEEVQRAVLWRRRARLYRDTLGRDAEAYRCLKEAHACAPADPEIAYQLRTAAMVRGEWALAASLLYREIASAANLRDRGALHLELALIYEERLDDEAQAQVNYEQALAFDPTIPAAKLPLARRYQAIGRHAEAAKMFEEAASSARAGDRAELLEAAARARAETAEPDLATRLDRAEVAGDLDAALELAHQLWRAEPGHAAAFRVLANVHRNSGELAALTELTSVRASRAVAPEERATAWLEVARLADEVGALDQAARAYDLALIEDPGHVGALDARGALAFRLGDFATADLIYRDLGVGESVLGDDELALRRSIIAEQLGRDTEALSHARAASEAAPGRRDIVMRVQELATRVGDLDVALMAARAVIDLVPLDDDDAQLATHFTLVELLRQAGDLDAAIRQLERVLRDHPIHTPAIEVLAELHIARADWTSATRYLYQLVPLAPSPTERADRLFRLGEAVLLHLNDTDRADDVFLRASDLDPTHVGTLRRLLDVYWRADDPGALVEVATELAERKALDNITHEQSLAHALVAAALVGDTALAQRIGGVLGDDAPRRVAAALAELTGREGRLQLTSASTAIAEFARRGMIDLAKVRAAAAGTPVADVLQ